MTRRAIVLDANILTRAVLGQRVRELITWHTADVSFFAPMPPSTRLDITCPRCSRSVASARRSPRDAR
jgi:hypothetical protein